MIDGQFDGVVASVHDVSIGESGFCKGLIKAEHVVICGKVEAQIACQRLDILATGELHGEVICREFVLEEGGEFVGQRYELMASGVVLALPEEIEHLRHHQLLEFAGLTLAFEKVEKS